jgi:hypothetical protein
MGRGVEVFARFLVATQRYGGRTRIERGSAEIEPLAQGNPNFHFAFLIDW